MELERNRERLRQLGLGVASVSYDTVEILRDFADRRGIMLPLLADPDSELIKRFGLLEEERYKPGSREFGVPKPVLLLTDADGVVRDKVFEEHYIQRLPVATLLARLRERQPGLPIPEPAPARETPAGRLDYLDVVTSASETELHPGNVFRLYVEVRPRAGVHVYASEVEGYQGLAVAIDPLPYLTVRAMHYPEARPMHLDALGETLPVYAERLRVTVDAALANRFELKPVYDAGGILRITGTLKLQACDDRVCWAPADIALGWALPLTAPDLERVPEPLRHETLRGPATPL